MPRAGPTGMPTATRILKLAAALLLSLRGSVCLYQGEEIGQTEAEIAFEDLADPWGKRFWPTIKGRDGCRTPMVWEAEAPNGGFSTAPKPWLPVPAEHLAAAVDRQAGRRGLAARDLSRASSPSARRIRRCAEGTLDFLDLARRPASPSARDLDGRARCSASSTCPATAGTSRCRRRSRGRRRCDAAGGLGAGPLDGRAVLGSPRTAPSSPASTERRTTPTRANGAQGRTRTWPISSSAACARPMAR